MGGSFAPEIFIDGDGRIIPGQPQPLRNKEDVKKGVTVRTVDFWLFQPSGACVGPALSPVGGDTWEVSHTCVYVGDKLTPGEATGMGLTLSQKEDGGLFTDSWTRAITLVKG